MRRPVIHNTRPTPTGIIPAGAFFYSALQRRMKFPRRAPINPAAPALLPALPPSLLSFTFNTTQKEPFYTKNDPKLLIFTFY